MNQPNMSKTPSSSGSEHPVKRKRGRPRKDESMPRKTSISPSQPPNIAIQPQQTVTMNPVGDNHNMVGQMVTGVVDGLFDAGYLISVRVGPNNTLLRGLVFQQGHFSQITPANDVAPNLNMYRRETFQNPISNQTQLCTPQASSAKQPPQLPMPVPMQNYQMNLIMTGGSSNSTLPHENLRNVGQCDLMHVFEVPKMLEEPPKNDDCGRIAKNDHLQSYSDVMVDSFNKDDIVNHPNPPCGTPIVQDFDCESTIDEAHKQTQDGEYPMSLTRIETAMVEPPPSFEIDETQQGEVSKIDVNQVPNQGLATEVE